MNRRTSLYSAQVHPSIDIRTYIQICWACFANPPANEAFDLGIMLKSKAQSIYLLREKDVQSLTTWTVGKWTGRAHTIVGRKQAKDLAMSKYANGMAGLIAEKEMRRVKAEKRREVSRFICSSPYFASDDHYCCMCAFPLHLTGYYGETGCQV